MSDFNDKISEILNTADSTAEFDPSDIRKNKVMAILSYLSILVLVPIFAAKDSKYARFHANQGIVLAVVEIIFGAAFGILGKLPIVGLIVGIVSGLFGLACIALSVIGILNVVNEKAKDLPVIGTFRILK